MATEKPCIKRGAAKGKLGRLWWFWDCEVCGERMDYLNEQSMVRGSLDHREKHRKVK